MQRRQLCHPPTHLGLFLVPTSILPSLQSSYHILLYIYTPVQNLCGIIINALYMKHQTAQVVSDDNKHEMGTAPVSDLRHTEMGEAYAELHAISLLRVSISPCFSEPPRARTPYPRPPYGLFGSGKGKGSLLQVHQMQTSQLSLFWSETRSLGGGLPKLILFLYYWYRTGSRVG